MVVVVVVVVDVVVLVDVVDDATARRAEVVAVVAREVPSSRPWKTSIEADTTTTATAMSAPITHPRVPSRPIPCGSAPRTPSLRTSGRGQPFLGISRNALPLLVSGSLGNPSTRSPRMLCWISSVPP